MTLARNAIQGDLARFRQQLRDREVPYQPLLRVNVWRPLCDIFMDCTVILLAVAVVAEVSAWLAPASLFVIGNRQRALGNVLHDGGHGNLHRSRVINDAIAGLFVAPLLFAGLPSYRKAHFMHHLELGDARHDPDHLTVPEGRVVGWLENYARKLFLAPVWWRSTTGHLFCSEFGLAERLYVVAWWGIVAFVLAWATDPQFVALFCILWLGARATAFHCITVFREMCDHFGLTPDGIVSFTRDFVSSGPCSHLVHPRNNGYHLTHHLLPAVPYYNLPEAQRLLSRLPMYRRHDRIYSAYVFGGKSVVASWRTGASA